MIAKTMLAGISGLGIAAIGRIGAGLAALAKSIVGMRMIRRDIQACSSAVGCGDSCLPRQFRGTGPTDKTDKDVAVSAEAAPPIACTLGADDFAQRANWIRELVSNHLISVSRTPLSLRLTYAPAAAKQVRELVQKEQACCAFLKFAVQQSKDAVRLTVTAPEEAREAAEFLFAHFAPDDAKPISTMETVR